jgi:hypothetical protein
MNIDDRKTNIIHTKLRRRCSGLNADLYRVNLKNDPRCVCGHLFEDAIHFFLECPLYQISFFKALLINEGKMTRGERE